MSPALVIVASIKNLLCFQIKLFLFAWTTLLSELNYQHPTVVLPVPPSLPPIAFCSEMPLNMHPLTSV